MFLGSLNEKNNKLKKFNSIQFLRCIGCFLIILFHCEYDLKSNFGIDLTINFFKYGWIAVPLFFMISGFIISYTSFFKKRDAKEFLYKRFARIYPLYLIILVVFLILLILFPKGTFGETFYQIDLRTVWDSLFFGFGEAKGYIGISWTLFYEICFCLFFLLLFLTLKKYQGLEISI